MEHTMANDDMILDLARTIRPFLPTLFGSGQEAVEHARALDQELAALLARAAAGHTVDQHILDRLSDPADVHNWAAKFLQRGMPPEPLSGRTRGFAPLAGRGEALAAAKYVCPENGDTVWYRRAVGEHVPKCTTHGVDLVPARPAACL